VWIGLRVEVITINSVANLERYQMIKVWKESTVDY
jgi:hypothetical protein